MQRKMPRFVEAQRASVIIRTVEVEVSRQDAKWEDSVPDGIDVIAVSQYSAFYRIHGAMHTNALLTVSLAVDTEPIVRQLEQSAKDLCVFSVHRLGLSEPRRHDCKELGFFLPGCG